MAKFKVIASDPSNGKSLASEIEGPRAQALVGRSIGQVVDGSALGLGSGKFMISGGCDKNGIPMRRDVHGGVKKYVVLAGGTGFRPTRHGERRRKLVRGRTITDETYQINLRKEKPESQVEAKPLAEPSKPEASKPLSTSAKGHSKTKKTTKK